MKQDVIFCKSCGNTLNVDSRYCPDCGYKRKGFLQRPLYGFTVLYIMSLVLSISLGVIGYIIYSNHQDLAGALYSMAAALGPVSLLGLVYEHLLKDSLKDAALTSFSELSQNVCQRSIAQLAVQQSNLEDLTKRLMHISRVGLIAALPERRYAFQYIEDAIQAEDKEIYIVGTSFRGLLWPGPGEERLMEIISDRIKNSSLKIRFLLTHPAFAHLRQSLEGIQRRENFHIAQEILETIRILRTAGVPHNSIRFVKGTPTVFGIMTSKIMLLNPYPYQRQAFTSITFILDSNNGENEVYRAFAQAHFSGVWDGTNVDSLESYDILSIQKIFDKSLHNMSLCASDKKIDYSSYDEALNVSSTIQKA